MPPMKYPGPDGIQALFFKNYWTNLGPSVMNLIAKAFEFSKIPRGINDLFLALIPKVEPPVECKDFRLIGLCKRSIKSLQR